MMFTVLFMNTFIHASDAQEFDPGPELEAGCGLKAHIAVCACVYAWRGPWRLNGQHMSLAPVVCVHYLAQFKFIRGLVRTAGSQDDRDEGLALDDI